MLDLYDENLNFCFRTEEGATEPMIMYSMCMERVFEVSHGDIQHSHTQRGKKNTEVLSKDSRSVGKYLLRPKKLSHEAAVLISTELWMRLNSAEVPLKKSSLNGFTFLLQCGNE